MLLGPTVLDGPCKDTCSHLPIQSVRTLVSTLRNLPCPDPATPTHPLPQAAGGDSSLGATLLASQVSLLPQTPGTARGSWPRTGRTAVSSPEGDVHVGGHTSCRGSSSH